MKYILYSVCVVLHALHPKGAILYAVHLGAAAAICLGFGGVQWHGVKGCYSRRFFRSSRSVESFLRQKKPGQHCRAWGFYIYYILNVFATTLSGSVLAPQLLWCFSFFFLLFSSSSTGYISLPSVSVVFVCKDARGLPSSLLPSIFSANVTCRNVVSRLFYGQQKPRYTMLLSYTVHSSTQELSLYHVHLSAVQYCSTVDSLD